VADKEWANYGFTDEMAIEVSGTFGVCLVWRDQSKKWEDDCGGAKKKQGPSVRCWGFIMWNDKGAFYVWDPETKEEREAATIEIPKLNAEYEAEDKLRNEEWKASQEWRELRERELKEAKEIRAAALGKGKKNHQKQPNRAGERSTKLGRSSEGRVVELTPGDTYNMFAGTFCGPTASDLRRRIRTLSLWRTVPHHRDLNTQHKNG
jgi:hypothetical protein